MRKETHNRSSDNASARMIGVVVSEYYFEEITGSLLAGALEVLREWRVPETNISIVKVPGSFEIPYGCVSLLKKKKYDTIIVLGCIIKGETKHDEYIAHAVAQGIMRLSLDHKIPIGFGVITTNTFAQARARSRGTTNKGAEAAQAALASLMSS